MKYQINAYFAALVVTIAGTLASVTIIRVAYNNVYTIAYTQGTTYQPSVHQ